MRARRLAGRSAAVIVVLGLSAAGAPCADATWSTPQALTSSSAFQPHVVVGGSGEAVVVWTQSGRVVSARGVPGGWLVRQVLWTGVAASSVVSLVAGADGRDLVVWEAGGRLHAAARGASQAFRALAVPGSRAANPPAIALNDSGRASLIWVQRRTRGTSGAIFLAACTLEAHRCAPPQRVAATGASPRVGVDGRGRATVAWIDAGGRSIDVAGYTPAGRRMSTQRIPVGQAVTGLHLLLAADGSAVLGWGADGLDARTPFAAYRAAGGRFSAALRLGSDLTGVAPLVTAPVHGGWWTTFVSGPGVPLAEYTGRVRTVRDATAELVSDPVDNVALAGGGDGRALYVIQTDQRLVVTTAAAGAQAEPATVLSSAAQSVESAPQAALRAGHAAVVWLQRDPFDPLDRAKASTGRVMLAGVALTSSVAVPSAP